MILVYIGISLGILLIRTMMPDIVNDLINRYILVSGISLEISSFKDCLPTELWTFPRYPKKTANMKGFPS